MKKVIIFVANESEKYKHKVVSDYSKQKTLNVLNNFHGMIQDKQISVSRKIKKLGK